MLSLKEIYRGLESVISGRKGESDKRNDNIVLKIVKGGKTIAYLTSESDGKVFTLTYTEDFLTSGVPPFNMMASEKPKIGKVYRSEILWYAFAARVPNPSRSDFQEALSQADLTGEEPILQIIGKLSKLSISKSWALEIDAA